jgi:hypothetical protein
LPVNASPAWAAAAAQRIWQRLAARDFAGWDPYDGAAATRPARQLRSSRTGLRFVTQAVKRCPVALQPLLGIAQAVDSYTLGQALLGGARMLAAGIGPVTRDDVGALIEQARGQALLRGRAWAWGYHFPVHTRFFSYGSDTPNLIVTSFVAKGLAAATRGGVIDCREELRGAAAFIRTELPRVVDESGQCFGYVPGERAVVHNANMLAALALCEVAELCDCADCRDDALACARFTIARQSADGSWPYSEESYGRWVDGFHTGFVLEGLSRVVAATGDEKLQAALERGIRFYVAQLFGPHGEPKYYPQRAYPLDALSAAQGVETLWLAVADAAQPAVPGQLDWVRKRLVRPDGMVAYQVHHTWTDWREFPRWASAPLMAALAGVAAGAGERGAGAAPDEGGGGQGR